MHRIDSPFIPHGLPETLLDLDAEDKGERHLDQVQREIAADANQGNTLKHNVAAVLRFAVDIENQFSRILSSYLICIDNDRQNFLDSALIRASWCTFSVKSELALKVIANSDLRKGHCTRNLPSLTPEEQAVPISNADIKAVRKKVKELGMWRNALAHGLITTSDNDDSTMYVNYFAQSQQRKELDDDFWVHLEGLMGDLADFIVPTRMFMEISARRTRKARHERNQS